MVAPISMVSTPKSSSMRSSLGNRIQIVDAAVAAVGPDGFVLGLFGQEVAVFIIEGAGTADHAAPVAAVGGRSFATALVFQSGLGLAADLACAFELSATENC